MGVVTVKSASITNRDASPQVANSAGGGAGYRSRHIDDYVSVAATDLSTSKYKLVRVPSTAIIKNVVIEWTAAGGSCAADIGVYYADDVRDLSPAQNLNSGVAISAAFFGSAVSLVSASASGGVDVTNESGTYTVDKRSMPLWQAAGLSADPGGKFDIVATLTADAASACKILGKVAYIEM